MNESKNKKRQLTINTKYDAIIGMTFFFGVFLIIPLFVGKYLDIVYGFPHMITAFISVVSGIIIIGVCSR